MSNTYSLNEKINLKAVARNFKDNKSINVRLTFLNGDKKELGKKEDKTIVLKYQAKYSFITNNIANSLGINPHDVAYIKGWMDS